MDGAVVTEIDDSAAYSIEYDQTTYMYRLIMPRQIDPWWPTSG